MFIVVKSINSLVRAYTNIIIGYKGVDLDTGDVLLDERLERYPMIETPNTKTVFSTSKRVLIDSGINYSEFKTRCTMLLGVYLRESKAAMVAPRKLHGMFIVEPNRPAYIDPKWASLKMEGCLPDKTDTDCLYVFHDQYDNIECGDGAMFLNRDELLRAYRKDTDWIPVNIVERKNSVVPLYTSILYGEGNYKFNLFHGGHKFKPYDPVIHVGYNKCSRCGGPFHRYFIIENPLHARCAGCFVGSVKHAIVVVNPDADECPEGMDPDLYEFAMNPSGVNTITRFTVKVYMTERAAVVIADSESDLLTLDKNIFGDRKVFKSIHK